MKKTNTSEKADIREATVQEQISRRAHELWEQAGRVAGRELEHWLDAEKQILGVANPGVESAAAWKTAATERKR